MDDDGEQIVDYGLLVIGRATKLRHVERVIESYLRAALAGTVVFVPTLELNDQDRWCIGNSQLLVGRHHTFA